MRNLRAAARKGALATIKRLHAEGVDVTERGQGCLTPIMLAALYGHTASVEFLQAAGASVVEMSDHGSSVLAVAARQGDLATLRHLHAEVVDMTKRGIGGVTPVMLADMYYHSTASDKFLLAAGASIVERSDRGCSVLISAAGQCAHSGRISAASRGN